MIFFASCATLLFFGQTYLCIRRLSSASQRWSYLQSRFNHSETVSTAEELAYFKDAAAYKKHAQKRKDADGKPINSGLDAALIKECGIKLSGYMQVPWCDILLCIGIAWSIYSLVVSLLGLNLGIVVLDYDLVVECGSGVLFVWALSLLWMTKKHVQLSWTRSSLVQQMCQFCSLMSALGVVYVVARAGSVVHIEPIMHPNMGSCTYTFDQGGIWSYSLVLSYNLLTLVSVLPRVMEHLPFVGAFEEEIHAKSD